MSRFLLLCLSLVLSTPLLAEVKPPALESRFALVLDEQGKVLLSKDADTTTPIASVTKLMTALVVMEANQPMDEMLTVTQEDRDALKSTHSRLGFGAQLTRQEMLTIALSSSENRAANALGRYYPGGLKACIRAMNAKAQLLGMAQTHFQDPTGLDPENRSTASDLAKLVQAAMAHPLIREASTTPETKVYPFPKKPALEYRVTNRFVQGSNPDWEVYLSKTGYIQEAGRCLVMRAKTAGQKLTIVLLHANGKLSPYGDSNRIRQWLGGEAVTPIASPRSATQEAKRVKKNSEPTAKTKALSKSKPPAKATAKAKAKAQPKAKTGVKAKAKK